MMDKFEEQLFDDELTGYGKGDQHDYGWDGGFTAGRESAINQIRDLYRQGKPGFIAEPVWTREHDAEQDCYRLCCTYLDLKLDIACSFWDLLLAELFKHRELTMRGELDQDTVSLQAWIEELAGHLHVPSATRIAERKSKIHERNARYSAILDLTRGSEWGPEGTPISLNWNTFEAIAYMDFMTSNSFRSMRAWRQHQGLLINERPWTIDPELPDGCIKPTEEQA